MKLQPLGDRLIVRVLDEEQETVVEAPSAAVLAWESEGGVSAERPAG